MVVMKFDNLSMFEIFLCLILEDKEIVNYSLKNINLGIFEY